MRELIDVQLNDKLMINQKHLGRIYERCRDLWTLRGDVHPIPELNHVPRGWIRTAEGELINIRDEIGHSAEKLIETATSVDAKFKIKQAQTMSQYMKMLRKHIGRLKKEDCNIYLGFYHSAKFGKPSLNFKSDDYAQFSLTFNKILQIIKPR